MRDRCQAKGCWDEATESCAQCSQPRCPSHMYTFMRQLYCLKCFVKHTTPN